MPDAASLPVPEINLPVEAIDAEVDRFERAVEASRQQLEKLKLKSATLPPPAGVEVGKNGKNAMGSCLSLAFRD